MATLLQKIQDVARRIDRLGQYASDRSALAVTKERGVLRISNGLLVLMCVPRDGRVWLESEANGPYPDLEPEVALKRLLSLESLLFEQASIKAREEVIQELVEKRIKRITRAKNRGFKADQKKRKAKRPST